MCFPGSGRSLRRFASPRLLATSLRLELMKSNKAIVKVIHAKPDSTLAPLIKEMLLRLGEDPGREGLERTPQRVDQALKFLTSGYRMDIGKIVNGALYEVQY